VTALPRSSIRAREVRALASAAAEHPQATPLLLTLDAIPPQPALPAPLQWQAAAAWLLGCELPSEEDAAAPKT
jgi:hypothetical protein